MKNINEMKEFKKVLRNKGIKFQVRKTGKLIITKSNGNVDLDSLTTMPDNVQFNNQGNVYLRSLTTMPDNVQFNNQGYVYLRSLTTMPDNVQFNNQGNVYLGRLTTMPDNVQFNNQGNVDLESLTTMPDNVQFNNQGNVDLGSLTSWKLKQLMTFDGSTMFVLSEKQKGEFKIFYCEYLGMSNLENKECFVAKKGRFSAHGTCIRSATEDVNFKFLQETLDVSNLVSEIKQKQSMSVNEYRLLTGACLAGCNHFLESKGITEREFPLAKAMELTSGSYGSVKIKELFN